MMKQALILAGILSIGILSAAPPTSAPARPLRVLCWNLHHGVGSDGKLDLERIAHVIRAQAPDLVALQEIDKHCSRSGSIDQCAELARLTKMTGVFGKAMDLQGGAYGQAILSRFPITASHTLPLPGKGEPRIAFSADVQIDGKVLRFISVHLELSAAQRLLQTQVLAGLTRELKSPAILCGDFNCIPSSAEFATLQPSWQLIAKSPPVATCPADYPSEEIDHFLSRSIPATAPAIVLPEAVASDHRPIFATFTLGKSPSHNPPADL